MHQRCKRCQTFPYPLGDSPAARTSFGSRGTASSVVDYFIVPAAHLPQVREMHVLEEAAVADHSCLTLALEAHLGQPLPADGTSTDPCFLRFSRPSDTERLAAAVAELSASAMLPALVAAAEQASTPAEIAAVAQRRSLAVAAACAGAGLRPVRSGGRGSGSPQGLPQQIVERFRLRPLRARLRITQWRHRGSAEANRCQTFPYPLYTPNVPALLCMCWHAGRP